MCCDIIANLCVDDDDDDDDDDADDENDNDDADDDGDDDDLDTHTQRDLRSDPHDHGLAIISQLISLAIRSQRTSSHHAIPSHWFSIALVCTKKQIQTIKEHITIRNHKNV